MVNNRMEEKLDLSIVYDNFSTCLMEDDDISLKQYLDSYEELNKFFTLMGAVFGFVSKDLKAKMEILEKFLLDEIRGTHFESVKRMVEYEKANDLLRKRGYVSGCRTLLRLHRGLDFIREFLRRVNELESSACTGQACREAYDQTLAKHHSFFVKNGAKLAMHTMPNKEELLKKVCGDDEKDIERALNSLPDMLTVSKIVHDRIENLYSLHDLHSLP